MTKPMYCPMSFQKGGAHGTLDVANECTPDCAWAIKEDGHCSCAVAILGACTQVQAIPEGRITVNARTLKDDAE